METRQLIQNAQDGDDGAVEELYSRYYPRVRKVVRAKLGANLRQRLEVDDVLQEVFLQSLLRLQSFEMRSDSAFIDWLATIALNQIRKMAEHWGRQKRSAREEVSLDYDADDAVSKRVRDITSRVTGPMTRAIHQEDDRLLEEALDSLDEEHRDVLVLRHFVGLSHQAIAERMGKPTEGAAREFYRRARARLAMELRRRGFQQGLKAFPAS